MNGTVLHLIDTGGPGGAETVYLNLVQHLPTVGWDSVAVVPEPGWLEEQLHRSGADPIRLPCSQSFDVGYILELRRIARRHHVQVIQTHLLGSAVYGSLVGRALGLPVICTFHGTPDFSRDGRWRRLKSWLIDRDRNRIVFVSRYLEERFRTFGTLKRSSSVVIHNGIDTSGSPTRSNGNLSREDLGIPDDAFLVGSVGNVRPAKAYPVLLRTAALLHEQADDWHFVIVGDTEVPAFEELLQLRAELGLARIVHFAGFRSDVLDVLQLLDAFCLPSISEGFSLSTGQAMLCGIPVVATRSGGPEELISDHETGLLVEAGSPTALAEALEAVRGDREGARRRAARASEFVRSKFQLTDMVARYRRLYEDAVDRD